MPRRRRLSGAVAGVGQALSDVMALLLQNRLIEGRQDKLRQMIGEQQGSANEAELLKSLITTFGPKVAEGGMDIEQFPEGVRPFFPTGPSLSRRRAGAVGDLAAATTADDPRLMPEGVRNLAAGRNIPMSQPILRRRSLGVDGDGTLPAFSGELGTEDSPEVAELLKMAEQQRGGLLAKEPTTSRTRFTPEGAQETVTSRARDIPLGGMAEAAERGPTQEATRRAVVHRATTQVEQDVLNDPENVRGFASREAALDYARRKSTLRADQEAGAGSFAPQYSVKEEQGPDGNLTYRVIEQRSGTSREITGGMPAETVTDAMRTAFAYGSRATKAHNLMTRLEPLIVQRGYLMAVGQLKLDQINAPESISDPVVRQYAQATADFINAGLGRPESGAQISETEFSRYRKTSAFTPGIDAGTLKQVQQSRREALGGLITRSGTRFGVMFTTPEELAQLPSAQGRDIEGVIKEAEASGYRVVR